MIYECLQMEKIIEHKTMLIVLSENPSLYVIGIECPEPLHLICCKKHRVCVGYLAYIFSILDCSIRQFKYFSLSFVNNGVLLFKRPRE